MNWYDRNHICVRDPRTGTFYISKSFNNQFLGGPFANKPTCLNAFIEAMDKKEFPWVNDCDSSSLMFVIGGAILTGFRLLHPNPPLDMFILESQSNEKSWRAAVKDLKERRRKTHEEVMAMSKEEVSLNLPQHQIDGKSYFFPLPICDQGPAASGGQGAGYGASPLH